MYTYVAFGVYYLIFNLSGYFIKFRMHMVRLTNEKCLCQNAKATRGIKIHIQRCVIKSQIIFAFSAFLKHIADDFIRTGEPFWVPKKQPDLGIERRTANHLIV